MNLSIKILIFIMTFSFTGNVLSQQKTHILTKDKMSKYGHLYLPEMTEWEFREGHDPSWANSITDDDSWQPLDSTEIANMVIDENGIFEGWFRIKIKLDSSFVSTPLFLIETSTGAFDVYINGKLFHQFGNTDYINGNFKGSSSRRSLPPNIPLAINQEVLIAFHLVDYMGFLNRSRQPGAKALGQRSLLSLVNQSYFNSRSERLIHNESIYNRLISALILLSFLFWLLALLNRTQKYLMLIAVCVTCIMAVPTLLYLSTFVQESKTTNVAFFVGLFRYVFTAGIIIFLPMLIASLFIDRIPKFLKVYGLVIITIGILSYLIWYRSSMDILIPLSSIIICIYYPIKYFKKLKGSKWIVVIGLLLTLSFIIISIVNFDFLKIEGLMNLRTEIWVISLITFPLSLLIFVAVRFKEMIGDIQAKASKVIEITEEKKNLLADQNIILEKQVKVRTSELNTSLENLKATQSQLIQSEKMASLGELTAGIAHEIQNPLNFVNNFSEVSKELMTEMKEELDNGDVKEAQEIGMDIEKNLDKINHHGKRASGIVKGMLDHSRTSKGEKELTDINLLADEYLRLSYHGLRAKDKSFTSDFKTQLDETIPKIKVVPQDLGRVLLNLINNAFYAVSEKRKDSDETYEPKVTVVTKNMDGQIEISVIDNGNGIPKDLVDKIFQPFFTTKPTGQGTGLGLSLSYDIVKTHGGEINVETKKGLGSEFIIYLPLNK